MTVERDILSKVLMNAPAAFEVVDLALFKIAVSREDDDISQQIRSQKWYVDEAFETEVFASFVTPGAHVLDLGANVGFYSMLARSRVGPSGRVIAFEPFPQSAALLEASIAANSFTNVSVIRAAVGAFCGRTSLYLAPDFWTEHSVHDLWSKLSVTPIEVPVTTVDNTLAGLNYGWHVDVVKMDIEGSEWDALQGMARLLAENPQMTLMTEFWPQGFHRCGVKPSQFLCRLHDEGFDFAVLDSKARRIDCVSVAELENLSARMETAAFPDNPVMQKWGWYANLLCRRGRH